MTENTKNLLRQEYKRANAFMQHLKDTEPSNWRIGILDKRLEQTISLAKRDGTDEEAKRLMESLKRFK